MSLRRSFVAAVSFCLLTVGLLLLLSCQSRPAVTGSLSEKLDSLRLARPELLSCVGAEDSAIVASILSRARENAWDEACVLDSLLPLFLDVPYVGGTLENNDSLGNERLTVNLRELDCMTFVENIAALYHLVRQRADAGAYPYMIMLLRYRQGRMGDYTTRLHYTTEWLLDNRRLGLLEDITPRYSREPALHRIDYMSTHPGAYPVLRDHPAMIGKMALIEQQLGKEAGLVYVPKSRIRESGILLPSDMVREVRGKTPEDYVFPLAEGDIVMIDTDVAGLDIGHLGFAHYRDGRLHLLHASSDAGRVVISQQPLCDYLAGIRRFTGIRIVRLK